MLNALWVKRGKNQVVNCAQTNKGGICRKNTVKLTINVTPCRKNKKPAISYFEVLSDCHQNQNFCQNILAFLLFA
jgi:hypothetical protein